MVSYNIIARQILALPEVIKCFQIVFVMFVIIHKWGAVCRDTSTVFNNLVCTGIRIQGKYPHNTIRGVYHICIINNDVKSLLCITL